MAYQTLYGGFKRLRDFPLDESALYDKYEDALKYAQDKNSVAYIGQPIVVKGDVGNKNGLYLIILSSDGTNRTLLPVSVNEDFKKRIEEIEKTLKTSNENFDTLQEISEWIMNHEEVIGNIEKIVSSGELNNLAEFISNINDRVKDLENAKLDSKEILNIVNSSDLKTANKTVILQLDGVTEKYYTFEKGIRVTSVDVEILTHATEYPNIVSIYYMNEENLELENKNIVTLDNIELRDYDLGTNMFSYEVNKTFDARYRIEVNIDATGFTGNMYINYFQTQ